MDNTAIEKSGLVSFLETKNISEETALSIAPSFEDFYNQAKEWKEKATIFLQDPNISQEEKAKQSRIARLALVKVRTGVDKTRKELNDDDNRRVKERNKAATALTELVSPIEELLLEEEKKQENEQKAINEAIKNERTEKLNVYGVDSTFYDLINMPEETFEALLENSRLAVQAKMDAEKKIEEERLEVEKYNLRVAKLMLLGFFAHDDAGFMHEYGMNVYLEEIRTKKDLDWTEIISNVEKEISRIKELKENAAKIEAERLAKENAVLQAQKDELERKEKEKEAKHNAAISRQQILYNLGFTLDYDSCYRMEHDEWIDLERVKNAEYQAEQNRLYIEKKKAEFEEAKAKKEAEEKAEKERANLLAPDKQKLLNAIENLKWLEIDLKSVESKTIQIGLSNKLDAYKKWALEEINKIK
jgi:hypothetical protein